MRHIVQKRETASVMRQPLHKIGWYNDWAEGIIGLSLIVDIQLSVLAELIRSQTGFLVAEVGEVRNVCEPQLRGNLLERVTGVLE